ncbi:uncharacterized protein LOC111493223 [Cucurbita maxima]|uniref:Uncharacterized protein LOC111493223 n=1 Tax=Cucurbita maxima TaxID=3661 RepID=A0A6J1KAN9_CUCMA|nr:uncharacterized protein LOC111493223 [Cucurbita maxima]
MKLYPSLQTYTVADNPHGWKFLSDMVDLFHVSIFFSDWSFRCTFSVLLFGPSSHHILEFAKTLEGKAPIKYSGEAEHLAVVPSVINGGITALYSILWGKGLKTCGPLRWVTFDYVYPLLFLLGSDSNDQTEQDQTELVLGLKEMAIPIFAGILSALRRVIPFDI